MSYINDDFLLRNEVAKYLYHNHAKSLPIIDYHNHLVASEIKEDYMYKDLSEIWLGHDHYKWRVMRACGVSEENITGNADGYEKFKSFVSSIERAIGNPVYHFSQLELKNYFEVDQSLTSKNTKLIWEQANKQLEQLTVKEIIKKSNVELLCTTDDPIDTLSDHEENVLPTFRPDQAIKLNSEWMEALGQAVGYEIRSYKLLIQALEERLLFFKSKGCLMSDHSLERFVFVNPLQHNIEINFNEFIIGNKLSTKETYRLKSAILVDLGKLYKKHNIVMQLHIGALRNNSERRFNEIGKDKGFDSIDDYPIIKSISRLLDILDLTDELPKTILYNLNPSDNVSLATMAANFQSEGIMSKVQFGPAWWFNDHKHGMRQQLIDYANHGVLGNFIGMLTDSRSYLSFARHEYFRRVLCDLIGEWAENGEVINDKEYLGNLVEDICYYNIKKYLGLGDE
jgi:glucuronate isomerase